VGRCVRGGRRGRLGHDPHADRAAVTAVLGAQLQESQLQNKITVAEAMELFASFYPKPADWHELLDRLGMSGQLTQRFAKLSGGQKQRRSIALAQLTHGSLPSALQLLVDDWSASRSIPASLQTTGRIRPLHDEIEAMLLRVAQESLTNVSKHADATRVGVTLSFMTDEVTAVQLIESVDLDVALMDLRMPGGGGVEAIREIGRRGLRCRVLVLTTYGSDGVSAEGCAAGAVVRGDPLGGGRPGRAVAGDHGNADVTCADAGERAVECSGA
jgi:CheY-like chemotaxis protein